MEILTADHIFDSVLNRNISEDRDLSSRIQADPGPRRNRAQNMNQIVGEQNMNQIVGEQNMNQIVRQQPKDIEDDPMSLNGFESIHEFILSN